MLTLLHLDIDGWHILPVDVRTKVNGLCVVSPCELKMGDGAVGESIRSLVFAHRKLFLCHGKRFAMNACAQDKRDKDVSEIQSSMSLTFSRCIATSLKVNERLL